jgi:hypothetical protein
MRRVGTALPTPFSDTFAGLAPRCRHPSVTPTMDWYRVAEHLTMPTEPFTGSRPDAAPLISNLKTRVDRAADCRAWGGYVTCPDFDPTSGGVVDTRLHGTPYHMGTPERVGSHRLRYANLRTPTPDRQTPTPDTHARIIMTTPTHSGGIISTTLHHNSVVTLIPPTWGKVYHYDTL